MPEALPQLDKTSSAQHSHVIMKFNKGTAPRTPQRRLLPRALQRDSEDHLTEITETDKTSQEQLTQLPMALISNPAEHQPRQSAMSSQRHSNTHNNSKHKRVSFKEAALEIPSTRGLHENDTQTQLPRALTPDDKPTRHEAKSLPEVLPQPDKKSSE